MIYPTMRCDDNHDVMTMTTTTATMMTTMMTMVMMTTARIRIMMVVDDDDDDDVDVNIHTYHLSISPPQELRVALREVAGAGAVPARRVLRRSCGSGDAQGEAAKLGQVEVGVH